MSSEIDRLRSELTSLREALVYWDNDHGVTSADELRDELADLISTRADLCYDQPYRVVDALMARINTYMNEVDQTIYAVIPEGWWGISLDNEVCARVEAARVRVGGVSPGPSDTPDATTPELPRTAGSGRAAGQPPPG